jgi:hypothetical protein
MPGDVFSAPEHLPPPLKKIVRPQEDIDKHALRLSTPRKQAEAHDDHMLAKSVAKSQAELEPSINRLYQQALDKQKRCKEKRAADEEASLKANTKTASEEEIADGVSRLYHRAIEQKKLTSEKLKAKHQFSPPPSPRKANVQECNDRVYKTALERQKEREAKLHEQYVTRSMPQTKTLTKEQVAASAARLCTTKGAVAN